MRRGGLPGARGEAAVTVRRYRAEWLCPHCGREHRLANELLIHAGGPTQAGTVAELYPKGDLPPAVVELVRCLAWCNKAGEYLEVGDPARVVLIPWEEG